MNSLKSPKEKLDCLSNFGYSLMLFKENHNENIDLLRLIAFCLIKGNVKNIKSNVIFIRLYRNKTLLTTNEDYFISLFEMGISYIDELNIETLKDDYLVDYTDNKTNLNIKAFLSDEDDNIKIFGFGSNLDGLGSLGEQSEIFADDISLIKGVNEHGDDDISLKSHKLKDSNLISISNNINYVELIKPNHFHFGDVSVLSKQSSKKNSSQKHIDCYLNSSTNLSSVNFRKIRCIYENKKFDDFSEIEIQNLFNDFKILSKKLEEHKVLLLQDRGNESDDS